jgi:hypothetical protein
MLTVHGSPLSKRTVAPQPISLLSAMCRIFGIDKARPSLTPFLAGLDRMLLALNEGRERD